MSVLLYLNPLWVLYWAWCLYEWLRPVPLETASKSLAVFERAVKYTPDG